MKAGVLKYLSFTLVHTLGWESIGAAQVPGTISDGMRI